MTLSPDAPVVHGPFVLRFSRHLSRLFLMGLGSYRRLKRQTGGDISISGSRSLVRSLLRDGLIDELRLMVHPVVVGSGKRLFEEGGDQIALELVDSKTFSTGVCLPHLPAGKRAGRRLRRVADALLHGCCTKAQVWPGAFS
jgi:dihydrofolate reductase